MGLRWLFYALSAVLWLGITACWLLRPNIAAALTYLPIWFCAAPGIVLLLLARWRGAHPAFPALLVLWAGTLLLFMEEPRSLLRVRPWPHPEWRAARQKGEALRVVSLNCGMGSVEAAAEVVPYRPDLVLLQETPSRPEVEKLAKRLYGSEVGVHWGPDQAILARGRVIPVPVPKAFRTRFLHARVKLASGMAMDVVNLHLSTPEVRLDLWNPDAWREQAALHRVQLRQVDAILKNTGKGPYAVPLIVGGDFNAPAGDAVYRRFPAGLRDAIRGGGQGWGNTILNDAPVHRIDQVWISEGFRAAGVLARKTRHSDHRMVVVDLILSGLPESR